MNYKFAVENKNYEDYSSGRVFYNQHGTTSFPVRLSSEIYQRCVSILMKQGFYKPYTIYDPCCGGAFLLSYLGYLHGEDISKIYASDIDESVIPLAQKNLSLLSREGLNERIKQIKKMIADFHKESHVEALESALNFKGILEKRDTCIEVKCFTADVTSAAVLKENVDNINIIITDLPYGDIVNWSGMQNEEDAVSKLLDNVFAILAEGSVISIISRRSLKIRHEKYKKAEQFVIGKRQINILQPAFSNK